jgi:hypothetical protein
MSAFSETFRLSGREKQSGTFAIRLLILLIIRYYHQYNDCWKILSGFIGTIEDGSAVLAENLPAGQ